MTEPSPADWTGRVVVVTGGSRGIGYGIAGRFAERGARVLFTSRKREGVESAARSLPGDVVGVVAHVADEAAARGCLDDAVARWGRIDVLVNNVGVNPHFGAILDIDRARWDKIFEINVWAPLMWTRLAIEAGLGRTEGAAVVNVSSNRSLAAGGPAGAYGASKATLNYLTQQLAVELAPSVRVNAVAPGVVDTAMAAMLVAQGERLTGQWPLPRFGIPADIADVVEFLAGPRSSWLTGQILVVDGGARLVSTTDLIEAADPLPVRESDRSTPGEACRRTASDSRPTS
jgi:NAD(P)-dependent dehydrogenase (short-subunit alcohol dehydrogenase family)